MTEQELIKQIDDFIEGRTDRLTYDGVVEWLKQMELSAPTQEDLGKTPDGTLIKFEND